MIIILLYVLEQCHSFSVTLLVRIQPDARTAERVFISPFVRSGTVAFARDIRRLLGRYMHLSWLIGRSREIITPVMPTKDHHFPSHDQSRFPMPLTLQQLVMTPMLALVTPTPVLETTLAPVLVTVVLVLVMTPAPVMTLPAPAAEDLEA